jgi:uncharacterized sodium:solute symporter family permease YidK
MDSLTILWSIMAIFFVTLIVAIIILGRDKKEKTPEEVEQEKLEKKRKTNKLITTFLSIIGAIGGIIGFSFIKAYFDTHGWPVWFFIIGGLLLILGVVMWFVKEASKEDGEISDDTDKQ